MQEFHEFINELVKDRAHIYWQKKITLEETTTALNRMITSISKGSAIYVVATENNRLVGYCGVMKEKPEV